MNDIAKMKIDWLLENKPWVYQKMKDRGELQEYLGYTEDEYSKRLEETKNELIKVFRTDDGRTFSDLSDEERTAVMNTISIQARELVQGDYLFV